MQQFFYPSEVHVGDDVPLAPEVDTQLRKVLRYRGGEKIRLIADEKAFLAAVSFTKKEARATVLEEIAEARELPTRLTLAMARIKRDKWEWALQKATELGCTDILPLETARTNEPAPTENRLVRQQRIVQEAAEQSERHKVPRLLEAATLEEALSTGDVCLVLAERRPESRTMQEALNELERAGESAPDVRIFVGPEGGFTPEEFALLEERAQLVTLGPRILRAETAAMLGVGMAAQWLETVGRVEE